MYLGAQRVLDDGGLSVTLYLYLHGDGLPPSQRAMLSDVRWISQLAPGQLARERHEGKVGGRSVVSYLEVTGPDETDIDSLRRVLDVLNEHVAAGSKAIVEVEQWGAHFYHGAEAGRAPLEELEELRIQLEEFFGDGEAVPPHRDLTIEVRRAGGETLFEWDGDSCEKLTVLAREWRPIRLAVLDEIREAFERQHGALYPHVLDLIRPHDEVEVEVELEALGGVAFKDAATRKVLWFSPTKIG